MGQIIILPNVRILFAKGIFLAEPYKGTGAPRYTGTFLVPKDSGLDKKVLATINEVGKEAFGKTWEAKWSEWKFAKGQCFYTNGDAKDADYNHGHNVVAAHRYEDSGAPSVVNRNIKEKLSLTDGVIYGGCRVNAKFEIWAQTRDYPGIRATLIAVQFVDDDEAIAGTTPANTDGFESIAVENDDMMGGL